jgi:hypothetical protein
MSTLNQLIETTFQLLAQAHTTKQGITPVEAGNSIALSCAELGRDIETGDPFILVILNAMAGFIFWGNRVRENHI